MRGAQNQVPGGQDHRGIIPADAGSTSWRFCFLLPSGDHPRRCGEHSVQCCRFCLFRGSSPQMRGARPLAGPGVPPHGIIPADAGSTGEVVIVGAVVLDHPRRCGEHYWGHLLLEPIPGSSPQMRGAPSGAQVGAAQTWIIPADAGSTH